MDSVAPSRSMLANHPILRDWIFVTKRLRLADEIVAAVARKHGLTLDQLKAPTRRADVSHPRHEAMFELRRRTKLSTPQIARKLGIKNHTSVLYGIRAHEARGGARG